MNTQFFFLKACNGLILGILLCNAVPTFSSQYESSAPLTAHQEAIIRKNIYWLCDNGDVINPNHIMEDGLTLQEVIDRDIKILNNHIDALERKREWVKGLFVQYIITAKNYVGYGVSAVSSAISIYFSIAGIIHFYDIYSKTETARVLSDLVANILRPSDLVATWNAIGDDAIKSDLQWLVGMLVVAPCIAKVAYDQFCDYDMALTIREKTYKAAIVTIKARMDRDRQAIIMLKNMKNQIASIVKQ